MGSTGGGEVAVLQLKRENARLRELYGRRSREIELKMGELRSALQQANEKYRELESVVEESRSLVSDSELIRGEEPEEGSGAQADHPLANTDCAKGNELQREVKEPRSILSDASLRKEEPLEGTAAGQERASTSAGGTSKRQSENSQEEPPRKMCHVPTRASEEEEDVNRRDGDGRSPLHQAAYEGDVPRVRELIARGADTRLRDRYGRTPIHLALWMFKEEVEVLLTDVDPGNDIEDGHGHTPLNWAARRGHVGTVQKLLAGGARTRVRDYFDQTPLHSALFFAREAVAELIVEADGNIELRDRRGRTPLHVAAERGFRTVVATLLQNDVNPHVRDKEGKYPIHLALRRGRRDDVPKAILSSCALKDVAPDWAELKLPPDDLRFCVEEVSCCSEEIRLMKETRVGASSLSCYELVMRHVSAVAPHLPSESVRGVLPRDRWERDFPHYADLISLRLRSAEERRDRMDRCRECFSLLPPELLLPVTCTGVVLRCLGDGDMEHLVGAVQSPPGE